MFTDLCKDRTKHIPMGEMLLLTNFLETPQASKFTVKDSNKIIDGTVFDSYIDSSFNGQFATKKYKYKGRFLTMKDIVWHDNIPYCYHKNLNQLIKFNSLHCLDGFKPLLPTLQRPNINR